MRAYRQLLLANKAWATELKDENPDFFARQIHGQQPEFLWIGCSDSRVNPEQMTMTQPGGMFIHRNIANLVHADDRNLMSVVQYAVTVLKVKHVIICGHHSCGGIKAALTGGVTGPVNDWLQNARDVYCAHKEEVDNAVTEEGRVNRLVEVNVRDQLIHMAKTDIIQAAFAANQPLKLHGWVYDIRDGLIKTLMEIDAETNLDEVDAPEPVL